MDLARLMIEQGANDLNQGLRGACAGGHMALVMLMIEKGADDWNGGLHEACFMGHVALIELMIAKGADNLNNGLYAVCRGEHAELIPFMMERGANAITQDIAPYAAKIEYTLWFHYLLPHVAFCNDQERDQFIQWGVGPSGFTDANHSRYAYAVWTRTLCDALPPSFVTSIVAHEIVPFL